MSKTHRIFVSLIGGMALGAVLSALIPQSDFINGWIAAALLLCPAFYALISVWQSFGRTNTLAWLIVLAFVTRLGFGIALSLALPIYGYDNDHQNAGYVFKDSYYRDQAAWSLAKSETPLLAAYGEEFAADQYGGLLSISAAIYRYISPDAHRSYLILILAAFITSLGVAFFHTAIHKRWGKPYANLATWIFILYPEGIFYSASQMREPFLIGCIAIAIWAVLSWSQSKRLAVVAAAGSILFMGLISWRITILIIGVLIIWFWLERSANPRTQSRKVMKYLIPAALLLAAFLVISSLTWLRSSMWWDFRMTETNSERLVIEIERIGTLFRAPIIIGFGVAQVVLPAAIIQPSIAIWRVITSIRSAGWYIMAPLLIYSAGAVWQEKIKRERYIIIWFILSSFLWILLASARAGGDLWDNPRYRTIFLPWLAFLVAWAWYHRGAWLWRLLAIEAIFLAFFTQWYLVRYYIGTWVRLPFWLMVGFVGGASALIVIGGLVWDRRHSIVSKSANQPSHNS